jgi:hypothetical protein
VARGDPSAVRPPWVPSPSGQPKTRLATSTQPVRDGTNRGKALFMEFLLS